MEALRPVEDRFFAMTERLVEEEELRASEATQPYRTDTPRGPSFVEASVLTGAGERLGPADFPAGLGIRCSGGAIRAGHQRRAQVPQARGLGRVEAGELSDPFEPVVHRVGVHV